MKSGPHLFPHNILYGQSGFQIFWERHAMRYDRRFQRYHRLITLQRMADFWMDINQWTAEKIYSALIGIHEGIIPPLTIFWSCSVAMAGLCSTHGTFCVCKISKKWIDWVPFVQSNSSTWQQWFYWFICTWLPITDRNICFILAILPFEISSWLWKIEYGFSLNKFLRCLLYFYPHQSLRNCEQILAEKKPKQ